MIRTRNARSSLLAVICGLAFGVGCSGLDQRPWFFPNRVKKQSSPAAIGNPKVELRPPSIDLPAEPAKIVPPLDAPIQ